MKKYRFHEKTVFATQMADVNALCDLQNGDFGFSSISQH